MKFLIVSKEALSVGLAWELSKEGHTVWVHIQSKVDKDVGDGFIEKVDSWEAHVDWADVIVFDYVGFASDVEKLRKAGKYVVGGGAYADRLEFDRDFGQAELKAAGLNTLSCWDFDSFDEAIAFLAKQPQRVVVKPNGRAQNDKILSFVGQEEDGRDIMEMLQHYKRGWGAKIKSFQLQKFAAGVEVAVGAYFNGKKFITPVCVNFEHKRMFNGNIGPATGEMGTSMFWCAPNQLYEQTLAKLSSRLAEARFVGYFDINCIANSRGIYPLECTSRFGYPTVNIQMEGLLTPWGEFLAALAKGEDYPLRAKRGYQVGVVVAVPPFPFVDPEAFRKYSEDAVVLFKKPIQDGFHPCDLKKVDDDWRLAGSFGYALVMTGAGTTMEEARREAYNKVRTITIPNMFYRTDIGEKWREDADRLMAWGYI